MSFLTAEWRKLILINYEIDPEIIAPYVPKGTELDFYKNTCYVSLVGFLFQKTKYTIKHASSEGLYPIFLVFTFTLIING